MREDSGHKWWQPWYTTLQRLQREFPAVLTAASEVDPPAGLQKQAKAAPALRSIRGRAMHNCPAETERRGGASSAVGCQVHLQLQKR